MTDAPEQLSAEQKWTTLDFDAAWEIQCQFFKDCAEDLADLWWGKTPNQSESHEHFVVRLARMQSQAWVKYRDAKMERIKG